MQKPAFPFSSLGFTLLELLITISVLAIVIAGAVIVLDPISALEKANDARRKSDLSQIQRALEQFYQDHRKYPSNTSEYKIKDISNPDPDVGIGWGNPWLPYMGTLPKDPNDSKSYVYTRSDLNTYLLYASLDRGGNDAQACNPDGTACPSAPTTGEPCGTGEVCNYGVSSPNVSP